MTTFGFEFIRSDRPLELSHSPDRAARNRLRGDDYMREVRGCSARAEVPSTTPILHEYGRRSHHEAKRDLPRCNKAPKAQ
jgi:hypothetical protein